LLEKEGGAAVSLSYQNQTTSPQWHEIHA